jgi:xanthine dehydrogenase accessory factor
MSRDLPALIPAFQRLRDQREPVALCTIMETEGSTYRKSGARMLIDSHGNYYGVLGGGCFEGDLVERSRDAIANGEASLVEYDMRGDEDLIWGLGLGCNGLVKLLLQPLSPDNDYQPMTFLADAVSELRPVVVATGFSGPALGRSMALDGLKFVDLGLDPESQADLAEECRRALEAGKPRIVELEDGSRVLVDLAPRQHHLLIIGAGPDAVPMAKMAADLHWRVTVADHREANPGSGHFPEKALQVRTPPEALAEAVSLATVSAALVMTHNFNADAGFLKSLASAPPPYIGLLGPTARRAKLLDELDERDRTALEPFIRGPVGLDIGGESPASIALAAIAEIHSVLEGADASPLNLRPSRSAA